MLFTYQKKTGKLITSQTTILPAVEQREYIQMDIYDNTNTNTNIKNKNNFYMNMFSRIENPTKCSSCN